MITRKKKLKIALKFFLKKSTYKKLTFEKLQVLKQQKKQPQKTTKKKQPQKTTKDCTMSVKVRKNITYSKI